MPRHRSRNKGFPLLLGGITLAGLLSALVDGTLGWETLAQNVLMHAVH
jgi:hypothetical protein